VHAYIAIFDVASLLTLGRCPENFCDDISNGSGVTVLTNIQTNKHPNKVTDTAENNITLAALRGW